MTYAKEKNLKKQVNTHDGEGNMRRNIVASLNSSQAIIFTFGLI